MWKFKFASNTFLSLTTPDFRFVWMASMGTSGGYFFQQVFIGWVVYDITGSAFITAMALALDTLPNLIGAPLGGVLVDRLNKRKILIFGPIYQLMLNIGFGIGVYLDKIDVWHILAFVTLMGCSWILIEPARTAITADILVPQRLINGLALIQLAFSITRLAGPIIGGILIEMFGTPTAIFTAAGVQLFAVLVASRIKIEFPLQESLTLRSALTGFSDSVGMVIKTPIVQGLILLSFLGPMILIPFTSGLFPVYIKKVFDLGATELGLMLALIGVGSIVGTICLASLGNLKRPGVLVVLSILLGVVSLVILAQSTGIVMASLGCFLIGLCFTGFQTLIGAMLQQAVTAEFRGRVAGLFMASWGTVTIGSLAAGALAEYQGAPFATMIGAAAMLIYGALVIIFYRTILTSRES
jgi:predicted MFS family arabinose efflux permease